jgi:hypothetical protein
MFRLKCPVNEARIGDVLRIFRRDDNNKEMIYTLDNEGISQDSMFLFLGLEKYFPKKGRPENLYFYFRHGNIILELTIHFLKMKYCAGSFWLKTRLSF